MMKPNNCFVLYISIIICLQHGAFYIYEVDDDNIPIENLQNFQLTSPTYMVMADTHNLTFNPYAHFGQPSLWPRGYPLDHFTLPTPHTYKLCELPAPVIQQGLVDVNPDVDSLVRLTRTNAQTDIHFDGTAPPVTLPRGTFAPTNSQNTLYRYQAFWSLVLPVTTTFRVCDIYRSYWAQRLIWLFGGHIGFYSPNAVHKRNKHSLIDDALQETDFLKIGQLLKVLSNWKCNRLHFFSCVSDLGEEMHKYGFLHKDDINLIDSWLTDLASLGYVSPLVKDESYHTCHSAHQDTLSLFFYPQPQNTSLPHTKDSFMPPGSTNMEDIVRFVKAHCGRSIHAQDLPASNLAQTISQDVLLIINIKGKGSTIPVLEAWYRRTFPHIIYCGKKGQVSTSLINQWKVSYLGLQDDIAHVACVTMAINMRYNVSGYLFVPETTLLEPKQILSHRQNQLWLTQDWLVDQPQTIKACQQSHIHCQTFSHEKLNALSEYVPHINIGSKIKVKLKQCFEKISADPTLYGGKEAYYLRDIVYYIPRRLSRFIQQIAQVYLSKSDAVQHDIIVVLLAECLEMTPEYLSHTSSLNNLNDQPVDYIFPYHMQDILSTQNQLKTHFCDRVFN